MNKFRVKFSDGESVYAWGKTPEDAKLYAQAKRIDEGKNYTVILVRKVQ